MLGRQYHFNKHGGGQFYQPHAALLVVEGTGTGKNEKPHAAGATGEPASQQKKNIKKAEAKQ